MKIGFMSKTPRNYTMNNIESDPISYCSPQLKDTAQSTITKDDTLTHNQQSKKPFNSTSERNEFYYHLFPGPGPDPGSYYRDILHLNNTYKSKYNGEPCFLSKENRFNYTQEDSPGPGNYNMNKYSTIQIHKENNKMNQLSPLRHYQPDTFKLIKPKTQDPGPGSYDINLQWTKQSYSSSKTSNPKIIDKTNQINNEKVTTKEETSTKTAIEMANHSIIKTKSYKKNINKPLSYHNQIRKNKKKDDQSLTDIIKQEVTKLKEKIEQQQKVVNNSSINDMGYYFHKNAIPQYQNFGSSSKRFTQPESHQNNIGPGEYIQTIINQPKVLFKPRYHFDSKNRYDVPNDNSKPLKSNNNINVDYTKKHNKELILNQVRKQRCNDRQNNGSKEKKFVSFDKTYLNPGPGSYIKDISSCISHRNPIPSYKQISSLSFKQQLKQLLPKEKNEGPSVGSYNADILSSIEYTLQHSKKTSIIKSKNPRFDYNKLLQNTNPNIGPGYYGNNTNTTKSHAYPFGSSKQKKTIFDMIFGDSRTCIGPGTYDSRSYFDWNRKSYNSELL